jgi:anti-anti-sigma factor
MPEGQLKPDTWTLQWSRPTRVDDDLRRGWVVAHGALDLAFADHLRAILDTALADRPPRLTLDLADVWLIDAGMIRLLVDFHERAAAINCRFRVAGAGGLVRRVLEITGLLPILTDESRSIVDLSTRRRSGR